MSEPGIPTLEARDLVKTFGHVVGLAGALAAAASAALICVPS